jgi:AcrR family transcriptional regulator
MGVLERKQREKDKRREQIQNAAKNLFIQKSYASTTMEEIAQEAELSPGTIYYYFKNKEELYVSLNLISLQYLLDRINKIYEDNRLPVEKKILQFKEAMYDTFKYDPLVLRNIFHAQIEDTLLTISRELLEKLNYYSKEIFATMAKVYEGGVREGILVENHPMAVADTIWGLFTGILIWEESKRKLNPQKDFLRSTLDTAFNIFFEGIQKNRK